jgi:hypothetical protein
MRTVLLQEWIDALRSGEFSQAKGALAKRDENGCVSYCCLGVLATIAGVEDSGVDTVDGLIEFDFDGSIEAGVIPFSHRQTIVEGVDLEMTVQDPGHPDNTTDVMRALSTMNDRGSPFPEIATYLERLA